jgi:hypothetical protein
MLSSNSLALKEWAVIVQALAEGKQTLLLRKGGLYERHGRFSTEPTEFFLFPTYVHQMEQGVVNETASELQAALATRPAEDQLMIRYYATVTEVHWLDSLDRVTALAGLHCWTPETIEKRFNYKKPGLYLFLLRVYALPQPHILPMLKRYAGCRSWVELGEELSTEDGTPMLTDPLFAERRRAISERIASNQ